MTLTQSEIYKCESCDWLFTTKFSLTRHNLTHGGNFKFKCKFCPKLFALNQYLKEHECIHTGEKPYLCGVNGCQERFRQRGKLSLHRRRHEGYKVKKYHAILKHLEREEGECHVCPKPETEVKENMSPNVTIGVWRNEEEDELYHAMIKVQPVERSLRKRKQVKYIDEDESIEDVIGETFNESLEEPSIPGQLTKNFCSLSKKHRKTSDMTDLTDNEAMRITPTKVKRQMAAHSPVVSEESLRKLRLLFEASWRM